MVPSEYRLDHVVARLIERLEGARPTWAGNPDGARAEFDRVAQAHVRAVIEEYRGLGYGLEPGGDQHASFLEREVRDTFLPRYHRYAVAMTEREESHFGLGPLGEPIGRVGLVVAAVLALFFLMRIIALPIAWPLLLLDLALPLLPDLAAVLYRRAHRRRLETVVADMSRIQDQSTHYLTTAQLEASGEPLRSRARQQREPERP